VKHNCRIESPDSSTDYELYSKPVGTNYKRPLNSQRIDPEVQYDVNLKKLTQHIVTMIKDPHNTHHNSER